MRSPADADVQVTELPLDPVSAGQARRFVSAALDGWALADLTDDAVLLTSEVVTNALLHTTSSHIRLRLVLLDDGVRVEVEDMSEVLPCARDSSRSATTGRGLALVEAAARSWGTRPGDHGKTVWFEIAADREG